MWALLPLIPLVWVAFAVFRRLRRIEENQQRQMLQGLSIGFVVAMLAASTVGLLSPIEVAFEPDDADRPVDSQTGR